MEENCFIARSWPALECLQTQRVGQTHEKKRTAHKRHVKRRFIRSKAHTQCSKPSGIWRTNRKQRAFNVCARNAEKTRQNSNSSNITTTTTRWGTKIRSHSMRNINSQANNIQKEQHTTHAKQAFANASSWARYRARCVADTKLVYFVASIGIVHSFVRSFSWNLLRFS